MKINNVKVYDLPESVKASKYPMSVQIGDCDAKITSRTLSLAQSAAGSGHDQFLTGVRVAFDLTCSNKMWIEAERYRFFEFVSSQSTMHRIAKFDFGRQCNEYVDPRIILVMNELKNRYNETKSTEDYLMLLYSNPSGFQLTARITTNYRQLKTIYMQRKDHRLPEWREFCEWIKTLPCAKGLIYND